MKCFLFACLILATATVAEAGGPRNNAQRNFNRGFRAGLNAANGGCNHGGQLNSRRFRNQNFNNGGGVEFTEIRSGLFGTRIRTVRN